MINIPSEGQRLCCNWIKKLNEELSIETGFSPFNQKQTFLIGFSQNIKKTASK